MKESDNIVPQKLFASVSSVPSMTTATNSTQADMMIVASSGTLFQVDSLGGSTAWGSGGGGGGAADGVNIVSLATATSGGGTGGTTYSNSTGTVGFYAGSNITISQSNNAMVFFGPSPSAASVAFSGGASSTNATGLTFTNSNNVSWTYDKTNIAAIAPFKVSGGTSSVTLTAITFSNSNGVSFGLNGSTMTGSIANYSLSFADANGVTFTQSTNGSSTTISASIRANAVVISGNTAGTANTYASGTMVLAGGSNITLSQSSNTISIIGASGGGGGGGAILVSAGTTSNTSLASLEFRNANNVSFGLGSGASLTRLTASIPAYSLVFVSESGNISWTTVTAGSTTSVYGSAPSGGGGGGGIALRAGTQTATSGTVYFSNEGTNNVSFGMSNTSVVTARVWVNVTDANNGAGTKMTGVTLDSTRNGIGLFFSGDGASGGTLYANHSLVRNIIAATAAGGGGTASLTSNVSFSNANGATFYTSAGNAIALSYTVPAVPTQSNQTLSMAMTSNTVGNTSGMSVDARSLTFQGLGGAYVGLSTSAGGSSIMVSVPAYSLVFSSTNGISFGTAIAGSTTTVTASVTHNTADFWDNAIIGAATSPIAGRALTDLAASVVQIAPMHAFDNAFPLDITANTLFLDMSASDSTAQMSKAFSSALHIGIYTSSGGSLNLLNSASTSWGFAAATNNSTAFAGERFLSLHSSQWSSLPKFVQGSRYFIAHLWTSSGVTLATGNLFGMYMYSTAPAGRFGTMGTSITGTATSQGQGRMYGIYSTTTAALPAVINNSELNKQTASAAFIPRVVMMSNTAASSY